MECIRRGYQRQNTVFYARYGKEYANEEISRAVDISLPIDATRKKKGLYQLHPLLGLLHQCKQSQHLGTGQYHFQAWLGVSSVIIITKQDES